jgi:hypothetical protein
VESADGCNLDIFHYKMQYNQSSGHTTIPSRASTFAMAKTKLGKRDFHSTFGTN